MALNPVRARLVARAQDWPWSSVAALLDGRDDGLTERAPVLQRVPDFAGLIAGEADDAAFAALRQAEGIGRPLGTAAFLKELEHRLGRAVTPRKRGRKPGSSKARVGETTTEASQSSLAIRDFGNAGTG